MKQFFAILLALLFASSGTTGKQTKPTSTSSPTEEPESVSEIDSDSDSDSEEENADSETTSEGEAADDTSDDPGDDTASIDADDSSDDTSPTVTDDSSDDAAQKAATVEMPNVLGMHYKDATTLLEETLTDAGFTDVCVALGWAWGNGDPKKTFTIIGQEPEAGTILDVNDASITVVIYAQEYGNE